MALATCSPAAVHLRRSGLKVTPQRITMAPVTRVQRTQLVVRCAAGGYAAVKSLPSSLQKIVGAFQMVPDPMARYKQLLYYAAKLAPLPAADHIPSNKVEGCVSQVWVKPELRDDGRVYWQADSDSQLTKGLAALLVTGLSGCTPAEILALQPEGFIEALGLRQSLTPSRNNGFLNMFRLMQRKTVPLAAAIGEGNTAAAGTPDAAPQEAVTGSSSAVEQGSSTTAAPAPPPAAASSNSNIETKPMVTAVPAAGSGSNSGSFDEDAAHAGSSAGATVSSSSDSSSSSRTPMQDSIRRKLTEALSPQRLVIEDQSSRHAGHSAMRALSAGRAGPVSETHFRLEVVSPTFEGLSLVKRQRLVYQLLQEELAGGLHALSLDTKAPSEAKL